MAVALDHLERLGDSPLVGGETVAALGALAAAAERRAAVGLTGLEGGGGGVAAGTGHSGECTWG